MSRNNEGSEAGDLSFKEEDVDVPTLGFQDKDRALQLLR